MGATVRANAAKVLAFRAHRHHLVERLSLADWAESTTVGLQDTPPGSGPAALAARVDGVTATTWETLRSDELDHGLVVSWSLRGAPFGHHRDDHDLFSVAALPDDDASWLAALGWQRNAAKEAGMDAVDAVGLVAGEVEDLLRAGPMTKSDVSTALRDRLPPGLLPWCRPCGVHHVPEQVLRVSGLLGGFVFGEDEEDGRFTLVRSDQWLDGARPGRSWAKPTPRAIPSGAQLTEPRRTLVRRYLGAYGPADATMLAGWMSVSPADARRRLDDLDAAGELVPVEVEGVRATRWLHVDDVEDLTATTPASVRGVRLLPPSDPFLGLRDRDILVPDRDQQKKVWRSLGSPGLVLVHGQARGVWRPRKKGKALTVDVEPFGPLAAKDRKALDGEAEIVGILRGCEQVEVTLPA